MYLAKPHYLLVKAVC